MSAFVLVQHQKEINLTCQHLFFYFLELKDIRLCSRKQSGSGKKHSCYYGQYFNYPFQSKAKQETYYTTKTNGTYKWHNVTLNAAHFSLLVSPCFGCFVTTCTEISFNCSPDESAPWYISTLLVDFI
jgi:hypothetical protein